jgi:hypothetical protein
MWWRDRSTSAAGMVEECEAFIDGRAAELAGARGAPVPVWAWMNLLAHGTEDDLRYEATAPPGSDRWRQARAFVAAELVDRIDSGRVSLAEFQRDVLMPLELDVMSCRAADQWSPGQLAGGLLAALPDRSSRARR